MKNAIQYLIFLGFISATSVAQATVGYYEAANVGATIFTILFYLALIVGLISLVSRMNKKKHELKEVKNTKDNTLSNIPDTQSDFNVSKFKRKP